MTIYDYVTFGVCDDCNSDFDMYLSDLSNQDAIYELYNSCDDCGDSLCNDDCSYHSDAGTFCNSCYEARENDNEEVEVPETIDSMSRVNLRNRHRELRDMERSTEQETEFQQIRQRLRYMIL